MKIKIFNHEICVCALLDTNSLCAKSGAEMGIKMEVIQRSLYAADFRFLVMTGEVSGTLQELPVNRLRFSKISGLESSMEYEEIAEGGRNEGPHILTAPHKRHTPLVLEHGVIPAQSRLAFLRPGMRLGTWLSVILLDASGKPTPRMFWITDGIVTKWESGSLDAMGNSVLVERFELLHDGIRFT